MGIYSHIPEPGPKVEVLVPKMGVITSNVIGKKFILAKSDVIYQKRLKFIMFVF